MPTAAATAPMTTSDGSHVAAFMVPPPTKQVLEHEDEMTSCGGGSGHGSKLDTSSRRAALLEGAMTSTISHPHVVQTYDYRVVHLDPQSSMHGVMRNRVLHETHIIMEFCDRGSLQVGATWKCISKPVAARLT